MSETDYLAMLCSRIETALQMLKPGGQVHVNLPPTWNPTMEQTFREWCEIKGVVIVSIDPHPDGLVVVSTK